MMDYKVTWIIDITAESHIEAARKALEIQRDKHSTATYFTVSSREPYSDTLDKPIPVDLESLR